MLTRIARHNDVLVVFVFDPLEGTFPSAGRLTASDGGRLLSFDSHRSSFRAEFQREFEGLREEARKFLLTRETPVLPLSTTEETMKQIARALGSRLPGGGS